VSLPAVGLVGLVLLLLLRRWQRQPPSLDTIGPPLLYPLGRARWGVGIIIGMGVVGLIAISLIGLLRQVGLSGSPPRWSLANALHAMSVTLRTGSPSLWESLAVGLWVGVQTGLLALVFCWLAREHRGLRRLGLALGLLAWVLPGPVIGLGMM